jgi:RNA polymerase sigma-70 factor (ECF subfamily)
MTLFVDALQKRDSAAWDAFYTAHLREIYGYLFRVTGGDRAAADDLFQETWIEAIDAIEQYEPERGEPRSWLFGIARRRVALYWRRRLGRTAAVAGERAEDVADEGLLPGDALQELEQVEAVQAALLVLSEDRRRVLTEKYIEGLSVDEIAKRNDKSTKAIESLLSRARDELRSLLRCHFPDSARNART